MILRELPAYTMRPKISVIIPVYNVSTYIAECLQSVQAQTLREIEIIPVNDCSPDQSQEIIDWLAANDDRVRPLVLSQNVGQGFARNEGLSVARGDYVWFIDGDDFMPSADHLQQVYDCAVVDDADMVRGRKIFEQVEDVEGKVVRMQRDSCEDYFDIPFHAATIITEPHIMRSRHFCNWLYRRTFLNEKRIRFLTSQWEERPFLLRALICAERISSTISEAFVYRIRQNSTSRRPKMIRDSFNQLSNLEQIVEILAEFGAFARDSSFSYVAGYMMAQALYILFYGFAWRTICDSGDEEARKKFLFKVSAAFDKAGLEYDALVFEAPQISQKHFGNKSCRLLFEALRSRRYDHISIAVNECSLRQETVMAELLKEPSGIRETAFQVALSLFSRNERIITTKCLDYLQEKPRLVVHVGQTKTGSTYLQHFLELNRPALLRLGVWIPDKGLFWQENRSHKQAGHVYVTREAATKGHEIKDHIEAALKLASGRIHTVILSSEAYFLNPQSVLISDHFKEYSVEMVGYFRRQDDWANSQYVELVAGGAIGRVKQDFTSWLKQSTTCKQLDYSSFCLSWAERIGRENVYTRFYDRALLKNCDIVSDFLNLLGLDYLDYLPRPGKLQSNDFFFNSAHVNLLREINSYNWTTHHQYLSFINDITNRLKSINYKYNRTEKKIQMITPLQRYRLMENLKESNINFTRTFCPEAKESFAPHFPEPASFKTKEDENITASEIKAIMETLKSYGFGSREDLIS